ncbi:uncharacterized protein LOC144597067 [Rhinoraja longicauda]
MCARRRNVPEQIDFTTGLSTSQQDIKPGKKRWQGLVFDGHCGRYLVTKFQEDFIGWKVFWELLTSSKALSCFPEETVRSQQHLLYQDKQTVATFESLMGYGTD